MRRVVLLCLLLALPLTVHAQVAETPLVVFVVERDLQTASVADPGPDGVSRLAEVFRSLGARTSFVRLSEPLPDDARVLVLPRPLRALSPEALARLWRHLERGNHLLLAIDPVGYPDRRIDGARSGLARLLEADYGVSLQDTFLAEHWFTRGSVADTGGSLVMAHADYLPHPIIAPLAQYEIPVMVWGARTLQTEPFGIASYAHALLITRTPYAETNLTVFTGDTALAFDMDVDFQGELSLAAVGENARTGSRVAVLGDSEIVMNGFGLARMMDAAGRESPRFPGNSILSQRIAAWLLGLPEDNWPGLPGGFTWITVDGAADDWDDRLSVAVNPAERESGGEPALFIEQVRIFRNDEYLYLLVETDRPAATAIEAGLTFQLRPLLSASPPVTLQTVRDADGNLRLVVIDADGVVSPLPDAAIAQGQHLELRVPLRVAGNNDVLEINDLCLLLSEQVTDCLERAVNVTRVTQRDPVPVRVSGVPLATLTNPALPSTNLRRGPGTDFAPVTALPNGTVLAVYGRSAAGDWVYVENARYGGWLAVPLVTLTIPVAALPVINH